MKNKIVILILFLSFVSPVRASEVLGKISTNPSNLNQETNNQSSHEGDDVVGGDDNNGNIESVIDPKHLSDSLPLLTKKNKTTKDKENKEGRKIKILGFSAYPDKSLLRGDDKRVYLIEGSFKKHIKTLKELKKYQGQIIFDVQNSILEEYQTRGHLDGDLIRERGDDKVFYIIHGQLRHVLNLEELKTYFFGQEIFNISTREMALYRS